jgi:hypothetical protein
LRRTSGPTSRSARPGKPYKYMYNIFIYTYTIIYTCVYARLCL